MAVRSGGQPKVAGAPAHEAQPPMAWGSARAHGLDHGTVFTFYGADREAPASRGVKVRATRPHGRLALVDVNTGAVVLEGGTAMRFWAHLTASKPRGGGRTPQRGAKASTRAPGVRMASAGGPPQHPGKAWLRMIDECGLSQSEVARRMGVAPVTLNRLVNGRGIPTAKVTVAFARALDVDVRELWDAVSEYELRLAIQQRAPRD